MIRRTNILPQGLAALPLQNAVSQAFIAYSGGGKYSPLNQRATVELSGVGIFGHHWVVRPFGGLFCVIF